MNKAELLDWLQKQNQEWDGLIEQIGLAHMDQAGVNGEWSMKDMTAHLNGWNRWFADSFQAAQQGEPAPPPPWPAELKDDDEINAWIYEAYREREASEVLEEARQVNQQILAVVERLPDDVRIETVEPAYYLVWLGDRRYQPGEFFDHFRDDHEPDVRAWLARGGEG